MNKKIEELKKLCGTNILIIEILEDFEKRLNDLENKYMIMEYHEINETGGVDNIKIGGTD